MITSEFESLFRDRRRRLRASSIRTRPRQIGYWAHLAPSLDAIPKQIPIPGLELMGWELEAILLRLLRPFDSPVAVALRKLHCLQLFFRSTKLSVQFVARARRNQLLGHALRT